MPVTLHPYRADLPELFIKEKERILHAISSIQDIHHVGSSAVPGLKGKNVIDIVIGVNEYTHIEDLVEDLKELGYISKWIDYEKEWSYLTSRDSASEGDFHVHILKKGGDDYKNWFAFRDYLIAHDKEKEIYASLKEAWLQESKGDGLIFAELKTDYIRSILHKARGRETKITLQSLPSITTKK